MELASAITAWRDCLGDQAVIAAADAQQLYGACTTGVERTIPAALRPRSADEIVAIVDIARRNGVPLYPISTGHNWGYGSANPVIDGCVVLDLSRLDRIIEMDAASGLVTLEPGVTQKHLADYLDRNGYHFLVPVTGAGPKGTFVRVLKPHVEGMLMHGQGVDVGDKLRVKLVCADPQRGFIDFVKV